MPVEPPASKHRERPIKHTDQPTAIVVDDAAKDGAGSIAVLVTAQGRDIDMTIQTSARNQPPHVTPRLIAVSLVSALLGAVAMLAGVGAWVALSTDGNSPSELSGQVGSPLYPASREGVRGHVALDSPLVAVRENARSTSSPLYPASREGVRGHVAIDSPLAAVRENARSTSSPLYPASREGVRGHVAIDSPLAGVRSTSSPLYPASREGVRGHVAID